MPDCNVNKKYLVLKAHYFLFNAALAGVVPFLAIYAKHLGISAIEVGAIYTTLPFLVLVAKPVFGAIADRFHVLKPMLVIFILLIMASNLGMNFIPMKERPTNYTLLKDIGTTCQNGTFFELCAFCKPVTRNHRSDSKNNSSSCYIELQKYQMEVNSYFSSSPEFRGRVRFVNSCHFVCCPAPKTNQTDCKGVVEESVKDYTGNENSLLNFTVTASEILWDRNSKQNGCTKASLSDCQGGHRSSKFQLALFFVLIIIFWVFYNSSVSLSDAVCYSTLKDKSYLYGKQRVWGSIGWGVFGILAAYLEEVSTGTSNIYDYSPGFYLLVALLCVDLIAVIKLDCTSVRVPVNIFKDVRKLIVKPRTATFLFGASMFGGATGFSRTYTFWYLRSLGASQLLLGVTLGAQCFLGELLLFFTAGWIIRKVGHMGTMTMAFFAYGIRFVCYSYVRTLWWVILLEILQGGFAAFYASMTGYATIISPKGTEKTMQGLVGGVFDGLGVAAGSLLGGLGFQYFNGRGTFFWAGICTLIAGFLHAVFQAIANVIEMKSETTLVNEEGGKDNPLKLSDITVY